MLAVEMKTQSSNESRDPEMLREMVASFKDMWWGCPSIPLDLGPAYSLVEKKRNEDKLADCLNGMAVEVDRAAMSLAGTQALEAQLLPLVSDFVRPAFGLEEAQISALGSYGFIEALRTFVCQARRFDPDLSPADLYQAGRNAWSMNLMQFLMGFPVEATPAVLAYSLLYPYSDNLLDDPAVPLSAKAGFNVRFQQRLEGNTVLPANAREQKIFELVGMIEGQFPRRAYPQLYVSLMAIYWAQTRSMDLQAAHASPYELDVLGLAFEKGGASTLADGYLVAGMLTPFQREFAFYYGAFTQLMDDLEDVERDRRDGIMTIFSQTAHRWPLDAVTGRAMSFGIGLLDMLGRFQTPGLETLEAAMRRSILPLMIDSALQAGALYTRRFRIEMENHFPFRYLRFTQMRRRIVPRISPERIVELMNRPQG